MEFDIHIEKIGQLDDIFGFYKYLVKKYDLKKHALLSLPQEAKPIKILWNLKTMRRIDRIIRFPSKIMWIIIWSLSILSAILHLTPTFLSQNYSQGIFFMEEC